MHKSNKKRNNSKRLTEDEELDAMDALENGSFLKKKNPFDGVSVEIKCKTENQKKFVNLVKDNEVIIASGYPGTGKTFLACAEALKLVKTGLFKRIILVKSVTPLKGEELGYLKGSLEEKVFQFTLSFADNFNKIVGSACTRELVSSGIIQFLPLAFIRGRTLDDSIIIADESQNISIDNMRTLMTRIGYSSKLIIIGDQKQIDIKNKRESALQMVMDKFNGIPKIGIMRFEKSDQVRNPLINIIEDVFDNNEQMD